MSATTHTDLLCNSQRRHDGERNTTDFWLACATTQQTSTTSATHTCPKQMCFCWRRDCGIARGVLQNRHAWNHFYEKAQQYNRMHQRRLMKQIKQHMFSAQHKWCIPMFGETYQTTKQTTTNVNQFQTCSET